MSEIFFEHWFPTIISYSFYNGHNNLVDTLVNRCYTIKDNTNSGGINWISSETYNTSDGMYDVFLDEHFEPLNSWVDSQVAKYCENLKIAGDIARHNSWFNIYKENDYQEIHTHPRSTVSAIYCLAGEENSAEIYFKSPKQDMFDVRYQEFTNDNHSIVKYPFQPGKLLIFLSDTAHSVGKHSLQTDRISVSYNYIQVPQ